MRHSEDSQRGLRQARRHNPKRMHRYLQRLPSRQDIVVAHTWWYTIFGLASLMVIQGVVPDLPDQTLVVEQTIATLWAGVQAVPRLPKSAIPKRSGRSRGAKQ